LYLLVRLVMVDYRLPILFCYWFRWVYSARRRGSSDLVVASSDLAVARSRWDCWRAAERRWSSVRSYCSYFLMSSYLVRDYD
jgi:hypothetical protein